MKLTIAVWGFFALSNAIPSIRKGRSSSTTRIDANSSDYRKFCSKVDNFFSDAKRNGILTYKSGQLKIQIEPKDLSLVDKNHDLGFFKTSAFSYVLANWYSNQLPKGTSSIKVKLDFGQPLGSHRHGEYIFNVDFKPITEPKLKDGKYHVVMNSRYDYGNFIAVLAYLEDKVDNWKDKVTGTCNWEAEDGGAGEYCEIVKSSKSLKELQDSIIYSPTKELEEAWSRC